MYRNTLDKLIAIRDAKKNDDGGFTLIELLVVVVIIGILIAIAIPLYLNYENGAQNKGAESDVRAAVSAVQQCYTDNGNALPATATGKGTAVTGGTGKLTLTCNGTAEDSPVSANSTVVYTPSGSNYTITGQTANSSTIYTFTSSTGQVTHN